MTKNVRFVWLSTLILGAGVFLGVELGMVLSDDNTYESLKKLEDAFIVVTQKYVDDVSSSELAESAIEGMLKDLDPHSVYIDAERMKQVNEDLTASFEGIGIAYELIPGPEGQDTLAVLNPLPGGPSEEVGLLSGDRIIEVDSKSAIGFTNEDVQRNLKGPGGTTVDVTVKRPGFPQTLYFTITRDKIPINTLDAAYMLDDRTGFIKLNRFARTTHQEFRAALSDLKSQGMERLVLDLRGNAGGYRDMAVRVSDELLPGGKVIVSTRGRFPDTNEEFRSRRGGLFETNPVIVLVDENSASASEIVGGALQDHDRALIVGRRTFGKGLVQQQFALNDGSTLRVTVSRYYTPSGRLIQTQYENGDRQEYYLSKLKQMEEDAAHDRTEAIANAPDSLKFKTAGGRIVVGGGGILPDFVVYSDTLSPFMQTVLARGLERSFVRDWLDRHGTDFKAQWSDRRQDYFDLFELAPGDVSDFVDFADRNGLVITEGTSLTTIDGTDEPSEFTTADLAADEELLKLLIKGRIASRIYDRSAWYPVYRTFDTVLENAMKLWSEAETMAYDDVVDD
jgi:carboxyl-terminal processing protease